MSKQQFSVNSLLNLLKILKSIDASRMDNPYPLPEEGFLHEVIERRDFLMVKGIPMEVHYKLVYVSDQLKQIRLSCIMIRPMDERLVAHFDKDSIVREVKNQLREKMTNVNTQQYFILTYFCP